METPPQDVNILKRRIAISVIADVSGFGTGTDRDNGSIGNTMSLGRRAAEMLAYQLAKSGEFMVLRRDDGKPLPPVNAVISGTLVEFDVRIDTGQAAEYPAGIRKAHAKLALRMVEPANGAVLFSDSGEAETRKAPVADSANGDGPGPESALGDQALEVAIVKLAARLAASLLGRPWSTSIVEAAEGKVIIAAGYRAGLRPGRILRIIRPGRQVKEPTSGVVLEMPGEEVGRIKVVSQFGSGDWDEGSVCALISGKDIAATDYVRLEDGR